MGPSGVCAQSSARIRSAISPPLASQSVEIKGISALSGDVLFTPSLSLLATTEANAIEVQRFRLTRKRVTADFSLFRQSMQGLAAETAGLRRGLGSKSVRPAVDEDRSRSAELRRHGREFLVDRGHVAGRLARADMIDLLTGRQPPRDARITRSSCRGTAFAFGAETAAVRLHLIPH